MGGGKSQKGGKHGFIGRTLAHDILARQAKQSEAMLGERPYRQVEQSVVERKSLDEFTLAAEQGMEVYLAARGGTREVVASDFNSQLARMVNYSEAREFKVFPVVPIPRRCLFFDDAQREVIGRLIKQREHMQHLKEKRLNKRRHKKLVDMYMHGSGPRPVNGVFEPRMLRARASKVAGGVSRGDVDGGAFSDLEFDELDEDGDGSEGSSEEGLSEEGEEEEGLVTADGHVGSRSGSVRRQVDGDLSDEDEEDDEEYDTDSEYYTETDGAEESQQESDSADDDSDSGFETEEEVVSDVATSADASGKAVGSESGDAATAGQIEGDVKYVKEYKKAIEEEVVGVDICKLDGKELNRIETRCFYTWRKLLAKIEDEEDRVVTPYEKNIEFWRQLWRVIERSHVLLIIVDARDPLFYRVPDLELYVKEVDSRKEMMLVLNKADHLSLELRKAWADYFKQKGVDFVFFSTIWGKADTARAEPEALEDPSCRVYNVEMLLGKINEYRRRQSAVFPELKEADDAEMPVYTVGFVGYPNVGKSSLINCLMEATKTTVSCQPGKTKHLQTLPLRKENITLCDCPGLIFPNIVATKHHLLVNSIVSTAHFRGSLLFAVQLICNRIPKQLCDRYDIDRAECVIVGKDNRPVLFSQKFLEFICHSRKFYSGGKGGQADIGRAAKLVVKDYVNGDLLYCAWPPTYNQVVADMDEQQERELAESLENLQIGEKGKNVLGDGVKVPRAVQVTELKMQQWLMDTAEDIPKEKEKPMTKRKMRFLIKGKRKQSNKKTAEPYA
ncbi:GTPase subfamily protein [Babesia caballi]|uniref:GTPase subfamily protein n=1 Tax=Babesia caballi TaxID=5871 RepID=A0AAV4LR69_BABCB|nr:GTPase subfamily protein [Babesia caballi]